MKSCQRLTCNVYFSCGQRSQVGRGECIETPSIHLGYTVPSVKFVVKIEAHLTTDKDKFLYNNALLETKKPFNMETGGTIFTNAIDT